MSKLIKSAIPISIQSMIISSLGLFDVLMLGAVGGTEVAAAGYVNKIIMVVYMLMIGLTSTGGVLFSQYIGAKNHQKLRDSHGVLTLMALLMALLMVVTIWLFSDVILSLGISDPNLLALSSSYLSIVLLTPIVFALTLPLEAAFRASGNTSTPTYISILAVFVNILLNYLLIFGFYSIPAMGIEGAALGTILSRVLQVGVLWLIATKRQKHLLPTFHFTELNDHFKKLTLLATPAIANEASLAFALFCYTVIYASMGIDELIIITMIAPIEGMVMSLFIGFAIACSLQLGRTIGAEKKEEAFSLAKLCLVIGPLFAAILSLMVIIGRESILGLYDGIDAHVKDQALSIIVVMMLGLILKTYNLTSMLGVLRAGMQNKVTLYIDLFSMWGIGLPLAALLVYSYDAPLIMVFSIIFVEEVVKAVLSTFFILKKSWLNSTVVEA